jgi:hypothetical protein
MAALGVTAACSSNSSLTTPTTGSVLVSTTTIGLAPDSNLTVSLDAGAAQHIGPSDSVQFDGISAGVHQITFTGITPNCISNIPSPVSVNVFADSVTRHAQDFTCIRPDSTSNIIIHTTTTGTAIDSTLFVSVDSGPAQPIGPHDSILITGVAIGSHIVAIDSVDAICSLAGAPSLTVQAALLTPGDARFDLTCIAPVVRIGKPSALRVTPRTSGPAAKEAGEAWAPRRQQLASRASPAR